MDLGAPIGEVHSTPEHITTQETVMPADSDVSGTSTSGHSVTHETDHVVDGVEHVPIQTTTVNQEKALPEVPVAHPVQPTAEYVQPAPSPEYVQPTPQRTAAQPADLPPSQQAPVSSTMDPHVPSSESAPTALPTNPGTHPADQAKALKNEHPHVVKREVEKTKAEERELKGEKAEGTIVAGMEDDRLYAMLRRFDQQITHVLHPATKLPAIEPDLRVSVLPGLPSHSDVLKTNVERVVAAIGPSSVRGAREVGRLMSWSPEERWRTGSFCAAYFICWIFGYTLVGVFSFFVAICCFPECRRFFFPPIAPPPFTPPSATDPTNQKGDESLIGNVDSSAVHRSKAEQAEEQAFEAASILQAFTTRLIFDGRKEGKQAGNSAVGQKTVEESSSDSDDDNDVHPDVTINKADHAKQGLESADVAVIAGDKISSDKPMSEKEKKKLASKAAKQKRDELVGKMTKGVETGLGDLADFIERLTNTFSPPDCYPDRYARFKLAGAFLIPPMFLFTFVPPAIFARGASFAFGVGFWGQPILIRAGKEFVKRVPNWQELLDMRNSLLSGVPTDAQLTLHLLRVAEALGTPLPRPPAPPLKGTPKEAIKDTTPATMTADDDAEVEEAEEEGGIKEAAVKTKHKTKEKVMGVFRSAGKKMAGFNGDVSVDGAKKKIGTKVDKVLFGNNIKDDNSISSYPAKLDGTSGHIILEGRNNVLNQPHISFVPLSGQKQHFTYPIDDIIEIKKSHVSMTRLALGWASGADIEGLGLVLRFKTMEEQLAEYQDGTSFEGVTMEFTSVGRREQLFVRLVSMGRQRWEVL